MALSPGKWTPVPKVGLGGYGPSSLAAPPGGRAFAYPSMAGVVTRYQCQLPVGHRIISSPAPDGVEMACNNCCLDFSPDGRWMVTSHGRYAFLRDVRTGRVMEMFDGGKPHGIEISTVAFSEQGRSLLRCSTRTGLRRHEILYNGEGLPSIGPGQNLDTEPGWIISDYTPDARRLFLVNLQTERARVLEIVHSKAHTLSSWAVPGIYSGALSPLADRVLVNCGALGTNHASLQLRVHRVSDGAVLNELIAPVSCDVVWSSDGKTALTSNGDDRSIFWNTENWTRRAELNGRAGGPMTTFAISPRLDFAVITRDESVFLIDLTGRTLARFELAGATGLAAGIRFLPDQRQFGILWRDGRVDVFDPAAMRQGLAEIGLNW